MNLQKALRRKIKYGPVVVCLTWHIIQHPNLCHSLSSSVFLSSFFGCNIENPNLKLFIFHSIQGFRIFKDIAELLFLSQTHRPPSRHITTRRWHDGVTFTVLVVCNCWLAMLPRLPIFIQTRGVKCKFRTIKYQTCLIFVIRGWGGCCWTGNSKIPHTWIVCGK